MVYLTSAQISAACTGITVRMGISTSGTCMPHQVSIQNNSSGSRASTAIYQLFINNTLADTAHGLSKSFNLNLYRGTYTVKLRSIDTSGCLDSAQQTLNIVRPYPRFKDYLSSYSETPEWINCIQLSTDPDSFQLLTQNEDSLLSLKVLWGDGQTDNFGVLPPDSNLSHWYTVSGTYTIRLITKDSAGCIDTVTGSVTNERVPTAGIIGPNSGFNIGCAPFSVTFVNNSKNISNGTIFTWDMGDGTEIVKGDDTYRDSLTHSYTSTLCNGTVQLTASNACGYSQTTWNPIQISRKDRARFTIDSSNCDSNGYVRFTNYSTDSFCVFPDSKQYFWDFGDGTNSGWTTSNGTQIHNYTTQGRKTVCLIARNACGEDTSCIPMNVVYTPVVDFTYDTLLGCDQVTVHVEDNSTGYGLTRLWTFGDGTSSSAKTVSHTYTQPGTYNLRLRVSNRCGSKSENVTVRVRRKPQASFTGVSDGCATHTINLNNNSTSDFGAVQYLWDLGNGDTSIVNSPTGINFTDSGSYAIRLIATDTCGSDTSIRHFRVDLYPAINIQTDSAYCSLDSVSFNNNSNNYDVILVNYGDGSSPDSIFTNDTFSHPYQISGTYSVIFHAINNGLCHAYDTVDVLIKPNSVAEFGLNDTAACAPHTFNITNLSSYASSYRWFVNDTLVSTGDTLAPITITSDTVVKHILLVALDTIGCLSDTLNKRIFTAKNPEAVITNPVDSGCGPLIDTLFNTSQFTDIYSWDLGNGTGSSAPEPTVSYPPNSSGDTTYFFRLVTTNWLGCTDTTFGSRTVFPIPVANFSMDTSNGCYPLVINFTNLSDPNGLGSFNDMHFDWDFGNGTTDTSINPTGILFPESSVQDSVYTITLRVSSPNGCPATTSSQATVYPKPTITFSTSVDSGCGPLGIQFQNNSVPNNAGSINLMSFTWTLGNGSTSNDRHPYTSYPSSLTQDTTYNIKLVGYTEHQCVDSSEHNIKVFPKPLAQFDMDTNDGCSPLQIHFTNTSTPYDTGTINDMGFSWSFDNGNSSIAISPTETFYEAGYTDKSYNVRLIAISEHLCRDTTQSTVTVHPTPTSVFNTDIDSGCGPLFVKFSNQSQLNDSNFWDMGSGFSYASPDTSFTFTSVNLKDTSYEVRLFSKSSNGCSSDTSLHSISVFAQPVAGFYANDDSLCEYETFILNNTSQGASGYRWDFGDGASDTVQHPEHQYTKGSDPYASLNFTVLLEAISSHNCIDSATHLLHIHPYTVASIGNLPDSFCSPATIYFTNNSTNYTISHWNFDNGDTSILSQPSYFYENISNVVRDKVVTLETENDFGCTNRDTIRFRILPEPIAQFSPFRLNICDSGYHTLVNTSINNTENLWDFGDGATSSQKEPYHLFARNSSGTAQYGIRLIVKNDWGCPDTAFRSIQMNPFLTVDIDTTVKPNVCNGDPVLFLNRSSFVDYHEWFFGDGGVSHDSIPEYFYAAPGTYNVKYIGYDIHGCPDSVEKNAIITVLDRPVAGFTYSPVQPKLPNSLVTFTNISTPATGLSYSWDFSDPPPSSNQHPTHQFSDSGWYNITLIVDNGYCQDTVLKSIYIAPPLPLPDFIASDTAGCSPFLVQFSEQSDDATGFRWFFDDGTESSEPNPQHTFIYEGYYDITLITYGPGGQTDTTYDQLIRVYPSPKAFFNVSPRERYLPNATFAATNESSDATGYRWTVSSTSNEVTQTSTSEHPVFVINQTGDFSVELIAENAFGCFDTFVRPLYLTVHDSGFIYVPNAFTPAGTPGVNDVFRPTLQSVSPDGYLFSIYNRWGEKIFETDQRDQAWDGSYMGDPCQLGQYVFLVRGRFYNGFDFEEKGTVLLLR